MNLVFARTVSGMGPSKQNHYEHWTNMNMIYVTYCVSVKSINTSIDLEFLAVPGEGA